MSLGEILKSIFQYLEVLQSANTDVVKSWNEESLINARRWAEFCEQIYSQAEGKSYQSELDSHIKRLGRLPWNIGGRTVDLYLLKDASQHIQHALDNNKFYEKSGEKDHDNEFYHEQPLPADLGEEIFMEVCSSDMIFRIVEQVGQTIKRSLLKQTAVAEQTSNTDSLSIKLQLDDWSKCQVDMIIKYLDIFRLDRYLLEDIMSEISMSDNGLLLLLCLVTRSVTLTDNSSISVLRRDIQSYLISCSEHKRRRLWNQPIKILALSFADNPDMLRQYTQYVTSVFRLDEDKCQSLHEGVHSRSQPSLSSWSSLPKRSEKKFFQSQLQYLTKCAGSKMSKTAEDLLNLAST